MIPVEMENLTIISAFKREVKNLKLGKCPCRRYKPYMQNVDIV